MIMLFIKSTGGNVIRNVTVNVADEKDLEFVHGLQSLGINRNVAGLIAYLQDMNKRSSRDIEIAMGLSQPEVSIAMRTLREMGWVLEQEIKGNGRGRPQKIYALRSTIDEIIKYYEMEKSQESARIMEAIQKLKEMSSA
jgi:predicted transcriptional regulator